jgi:IS605 OrfB family transposase
LITLKIPYKSNDEFKLFLNNLRREYSSLVRYSYNRLKEGISEKDIRSLHKSLNNIDNLDAWTRQCAINEAKQILNKHGENKVHFGGKSNMVRYLKGLITKDQYKNTRLLPLNIFGEAANNGNRKFKLDLFNDKIIYKHSRKEHFQLEIPKLRGSYKQLYNLMENPRTYSVKLTDNHILISFEEVKEQNTLSENRYLGIDLNPEYIGISIKEDDKIIYTKLYSVKKLTDKIINLKVKSIDKRFKTLNNKLNHEILEISKDISELSKRFGCKFIFIEDLSFKGSTKYSNRKNKNLWKREILINNLRKRSSINGQKLYKVNPAYSSFIGNLQWKYDDPVNASLEIGRRGFECIIKKTKQFYPEIKLKEELIHQWKEKINLDNFKTWKELFSFIKNLELRYRVSTGVVFSEFKTSKSLVGYINHQSYLCN